jgi:predicted branched-subunit amino acid permease
MLIETKYQLHKEFADIILSSTGTVAFIKIFITMRHVFYSLGLSHKQYDERYNDTEERITICINTSTTVNMQHSSDVETTPVC